MALLLRSSRLYSSSPCSIILSLRTAPASQSSQRNYATQSSLGSSTTPTARRKAVTIANDDGRVRWGDLTTGEKVARTTQTSFYSTVVIVGMIATGGVFTYLFLDVFSPDSPTSYFNSATDRIRRSTACQGVLGEGSKIEAHGEPSHSRWARNRRIASRTEKDRFGTEHMYMHFYITGPLNEGTVRIHLSKRSGERAYEYRYLALDVRGHQRIYLENADAQPDKKQAGKIFGVRWW